VTDPTTDPDVALAFEVVAHLEDYDGDYPNAEKLRGSLNRLAARLAEAEQGEERYRYQYERKVAERDEALRERDALREALDRLREAVEPFALDAAAIEKLRKALAAAQDKGAA
jgi:hypothetical protein